MKTSRAVIERYLLSPIHPFLLSVYFVIRVYDANGASVPLRDLFRPLLFSVLASAVVFLLFLRWVRSQQTAAFITSILIAAFYLYTLAWAVLPARKYMPASTFASLWAFTVVLLIVLLGWKMRAAPNVNLIAGINLMALILLLFPFIGLAVVAVSRALFPAPKVHHAVEGPLSGPSPDIYYIILDSYPRADVLQESYGYDNTSFIQSLEDLGFYVAECSQSNFAITGLSLTSSLNLEYLQNLSDAFRPDTGEFVGLFKYLDENSVQESVTNLGYRTISFASGFPWVEWRDADVLLAPPEGPMTEFEALLLQSTYASILDNTRWVDYEEKYAERFRRRTWFVLESFEWLAAEPGPKFVFIHLIVPHPPYAFDEYGNPVPASQVNPETGFLDQVKFINTFILPGLRTLIEKSPTPPVILLQGDHGPTLEGNIPAQMKILNAYYLPEGQEHLYPSISPVNSFRVVFNTYFGTSFPILEDVSYYSDRRLRYKFSVIESTCPE